MPLLARFLTSMLLVTGLPHTVQTAPQPPQQMGRFENSIDIGGAQAGSTRYNASLASYEVRGGGADVWGTADAFRFVWTQLAGDASFAADVHINAPVTYYLSKGMLMFRQSLDPGSPYADIAVHADGHITLQYRQVPGGETRDITLPEHNVRRLRIVRHGNVFTAYAQSGSSARTPATSVSVPMHGPVYVGLGVCSHNTDVLQTVTFSRLELSNTAR